MIVTLNSAECYLILSGIIGLKRIPAEKQLIVGLDDPFPEVREACHRALVRMARGTDFGPQPFAAQAKIDGAIKRWSGWLALQDPVTRSARPHRQEMPSLEPIDLNYRFGESAPKSRTAEIDLNSRLGEKKKN